MNGFENFQIETFDYIHKSIQLLHIMGSIFRENNLESTSCGILLRLGFNEDNKICDFDFEAKILDLTLPFSENGRSLSILHSFSSCATSEIKRKCNLPEDTIHMNFFRKFSKFFPKQTQERFILNDYEIWNRFHSLLNFFEFSSDEVLEILQIMSFILGLNELTIVKKEKDKKCKLEISKGRFYKSILANLKIEEDKLDAALGSFKDEVDAKNTLMSLMKYSYYILFEYIKNKMKARLKDFFAYVQEQALLQLLNNDNKEPSNKNFNKNRSSSASRKNINRSSSNKKISSNTSSQKRLQKSKSNASMGKTKITYINFLDVPGEVKDQTLGGLVTNLTNECIQLIAGNSYSSIVEKLISENLFLNLFKPLHSYNLVRSIIGDKGLLSYISNKFTEKNFRELIDNTTKKSYFKGTIDFPDKDSTSKNANLCKMVLKYSHRNVTYNYETLYKESKTIINTTKILKLFASCQNSIIASTYEKVIKPKLTILEFVNESLTSLFKPIENITPFVIYCLHSNNSHNIFFGSKDDVVKQNSNWVIPLHLTQYMIKKSVVMPVLYWEWFGFHTWMELREFLNEFEEIYLKIREYNKKSLSKNNDSEKDLQDYMALEDYEKVQQILSSCYINRDAIVGNNYIIMKKGAIKKIKDKLNKNMNRVALKEFQEKNKGNKLKKNYSYVDFFSDLNKEESNPQREFKKQCHLDIITADNDNAEAKENYSNFNVYKIMNKSTDAKLEEYEEKPNENERMLKKMKDKKSNIVVASQDLFSDVQNLLDEKKDFDKFDYSNNIDDILLIQRNYRAYKEMQRSKLRHYVLLQIGHLTSRIKGRFIRKKFKNFIKCLKSIYLIQRCTRRLLARTKFNRKYARYKQCLENGEEYCDTSDEEKRNRIEKKKKIKQLEDERKKYMEKMEQKKNPAAANKKKTVKKVVPKVFKEYAMDDKNKKKKENHGIDPTTITDKNQLIEAILFDNNLMKENDKKNRELANQKKTARDNKKIDLLGIHKNEDANDLSNNNTNTNNKQPNKKQKIEDKLIEYGELIKQRRAQNQVEKLKKEEMQNSFKPKINKYNPKIEKTNFYERAKKYEEMKETKKEQIKTTMTGQESDELTFKPKLTKQGKSIKRNIEDLYKWKEKRDKKLEEQAILRKQKENEDYERSKETPVFFNDKSKRILEKKKAREKLEKEKQDKKEKEENNEEEENCIELWPGFAKVRYFDGDEDFATNSKKGIFENEEDEEEEEREDEICDLYKFDK